MNWTALLAKAGIPDSPGRQEAVDATNAHTREKLELYGPPQVNRGSNSSCPSNTVSRKALQAKERAQS